jgi:hypothetical protein
MRKILLILFFASVAIMAGLCFTYIVRAATSSEYINIYGGSFVDCPTNGNCNQYHVQGNNCNANTGSCSGNTTDWVYRWDCTVSNNQIPGDRVCGGGTLQPAAPTKSQNSLSLNTSSVACGHVIQLDVYDKDCETVGWGNCSTKDYLVWYSGDCAQATQTATATQTPTASVTQGPACGSACTTSADCTQSPTNSCTACIGGTCQPPTTVTEPPVTEPPVTEPPVTATPTPEFNPAMCACNGTSVSSLVPGTQATVTANYQIVGEDQSKATMNNVTFVMYEGDNTTGKAILHSDPIPVAITSLNNERTQYQAQWTFTVPTNVDPNIVYRVTTASDCKATGLSQTSMNVQVAGVSTGPTSQPQKKAQKQSFWASITSFFQSLFGLNNQAATTSIQSTTPTPTKDPVYTTQGNQIQIGKMTPPAKILPQTACNILRFEFSK